MKGFSFRFVLMVGFNALFSTSLLGQMAYQSSNYATVGDSVFLTNAQLGSSTFSNTGPNVIWDYSGLIGSGQRLVQFRAPNQTGFTPAQWPYIQNSSNVNLSSTDESVVSLGMVQYSEPNDYFLVSGTSLSQKAVSSKLTINSTSFILKTVYSTPDIVYHFPLAYGNTPDSSEASYTSSIPNVYYKQTSLKRKNTIDGWGELTTPYGTFSGCIRLNSEITRIDSMSVDTIGFPKDTTFLRELKWFHPSFNYPLLTVNENLVNGTYVTSGIEYADNQQFFQPTALFAYLPIFPQVGDTVSFQNLSNNAVSYSWKFNDSASAVETSVLTNPQHIFSLAGTYPIQLIAWNGTLSDSIIIPVVVTDTTLPIASFSWMEVPAFIGDSIHFQNTSQYALQADWDFDDPSSGSLNTSAAFNPVHIFNQVGTYSVRLIASNGLGNDTLVQFLTILDTLQAQAAFFWLPDTIYENDTVLFQNLSQFATDFIWDFGDPVSGTNNTSIQIYPTHIYQLQGTYSVRLIAMNESFSDTLTKQLIVLPLSAASLNQFDMLEEISIYPNPADDHICIEPFGDYESFPVRFYNYLGECCLDTFVNKDLVVDISTLKPGVYTLIVLIDQRLFQAKFMKK